MVKLRADIVKLRAEIARDIVKAVSQVLDSQDYGLAIGMARAHGPWPMAHDP